MKKLLALVVIVILAFSLVSCSSGANNKYLRVGVDDIYPPMEYKNDKDERVGFDIDIATEVAKRLGKEVKFESVAWTGIFESLKSDKYDVVISSVSVTESRLKEFSLTKPYIANSQIIIVPSSNTTIKGPEDLAGKKVGCQVETTANTSAETLLKKNIKFSLQTYDSVTFPFDAMKSGRIDAIIVDEVVGQYYVKLSPELYRVVENKLTNEPIAVCVKKENTELRDKIDKVLVDMRADGTMKKISEKWFGKDLVSNIDETLKELE